MPDIVTLLQSPYMIRSIVAIVFIAVNAAIAGTFTIYRNASFLIAGVSHAALAGAAMIIVLVSYAIIPPVHPLWGALVFAVLMAVLAGYASRRGDDKSLNTTIGIGFAMSMSLAVIFISLIREYSSRVWGLLFGDLLLLTETDIVLLLVSTAIVSFVAVIFYREFIFISFDMEGAIAYGIRAERYNYLMLILIAVSVIVILKGVGSILVFAMLISPAATANRIADSTQKVMVYSFILALVSGFVGLAASFYIEVSPGAIASLIATSMYFVVMVFKKE